MDRDKEFLRFLYTWTHSLYGAVNLDPFNIIGRHNIESIQCWLDGFTVIVQVPQRGGVQPVLVCAKRIFEQEQIELGLRCQTVKNGKVSLYSGVSLSAGRHKAVRKRVENKGSVKALPMNTNLSRSLTDARLRRLVTQDRGTTVFVHDATDEFKHLFIKPDLLVKAPERRLNKPIVDLLGQPLGVVDSDIAEVKRSVLEECRERHGVIWREYSHVWKGYEFNFLYSAEWLDGEILTRTIDHPDKKPVDFKSQRALFEYVNELVTA